MTWSCCCLVAKSCPNLCNLWTAASEAPLSSTTSQSLLKFMSIELKCYLTISYSAVPFPFCPQSQHQGLFQGVSSSHQVVWYSHLLKHFPQFVVICIAKGFSIANEAVYVFLELPFFLRDPTNVGNLISGSSAFSESNLYIWNFSVHILLKPSLKDFERNLDNMRNEHNCMVVWAFFGNAFL